MDKSLNIEKHIQKLCQTSIAQLGNIANVRKYLIQNAAEKIIHACITSRLDYYNTLLYCLPSSSLKKLTKILTLRRKYEHITPILQELHWLPVEHRITYKILLTTHRALNGTAPQYITDLLTLSIPACNLRSELEGYLVVPKTRTKTIGERAFSFAAAVEWNKLPKKLRENNTLSQFKSCIKTFLFTTAFRQLTNICEMPQRRYTFKLFLNLYLPVLIHSFFTFK